MKNLRLVLVVLMSILLPIRGAVAATLMCPQGEGPRPAVVVADQARHHHHHEMQGDHAMHADHPAAHHHGGSADVVEHDDVYSADHPSTCHWCASGCCMPCMVGTVPPPGLPSVTSPVEFPALTARVPAFLSGGLDRPPRNI